MLRSRRFLQQLVAVVSVLFLVGVAVPVYAVVNPQSGSVGVEGTLGAPPPTQGGSIAIPSSGAVFTTNPVTVSGLCPEGLLVKVFSNNVFVGSEQCTNGSFSIQVDLFSGLNDIVVRVYDALDQAGPDSNTIAITLNNAQFAQFGVQMTLTSSYAKRGADPGQELDWPIILSGGTGPYALSVDWGDGKTPELLSASFSGNITISHTYASAGVYTVVVRVTDANGQAAFLQLVGVANGPVTQSNSTASNTTTSTRTIVLWWPSLVALPLIVASFWLGSRHELFNLRRQLEHSDDHEV
jgi:PKD domain-containing protein